MGDWPVLTLTVSCFLVVCALVYLSTRNPEVELVTGTVVELHVGQQLASSRISIPVVSSVST
jgi:hypothetical protein